ncbi:hypothetical protein BZJ21_13385 [Salinivibrio costicola subsp. alcaliphilus]|uniref:Type I restriction modification DNA specificity domain-containing protein n=1 Tax=Salinivibrio costicola subsp. alcaliphilus TaxID=272773 RepID=A0ABX3KN91_SALCS|nr:hypothetical protein BZJ21_13385 [Salinivibrio costicola subsp. alcaliphilus]
MFLALNSEIVQRQIRSFQFTADTIDTIGNRFLDVVLPIPRDLSLTARLSAEAKLAMEEREKGKAFIKQAPVILEETLLTGKLDYIDEFFASDLEEIVDELKQDTITSEFGKFEAFWRRSSDIKDKILLPKYYNPEVEKELSGLSVNCECVSIGSLIDAGVISDKTGVEIGKMAYGTGDIPFIRTSDFCNWEMKHNPKQGISQDIYDKYCGKIDLKKGDIFLVRDGTYLVGGSCIVTDRDTKALFCGGLYKLRVEDQSELDEWLLLALLNTYVVKRQLRTKQFTRDVIDTLGRRLYEVILPIPKDKKVRQGLSDKVRRVVEMRLDNRDKIMELSQQLTHV